MRALNLLERRVRRFSQQPPSVRAAAGAIVFTTLVAVVAAGALMRLLDGDEYPSIGLGMWWALQTVTTVGYGDAVPTNVVGRILAAVVMLEGTAFVAIVTAAVTSTFVARATLDQEAKDDLTDRELIEARLDALDQKLDTLAAMLRGSNDA